MEDRGRTVFNVTLILTILATVFVAMRLCSKWYIVKRNNSDDVFTIIAWLFTVGLSVSIMLATKAGLGSPDSVLDTSRSMDLKKAVYAFTVLYNPALMATKTAILLLYIRMAQAHTFLRYASYATLAIVNIAGIVLTFLNIFQCSPVSSAYSSQEGQCLDVVTLYFASAPINVLTDLAVLLLPLPILTKLRMEFRQKIALVATFTVGGFVTIVDIIRIAYLQEAFRAEYIAETAAALLRASEGSQLGQSQSRPPNFVYHVSYSLMFSGVEVTVGLMCCCVLVLKPLVMRVVPKLLMRDGAAYTLPRFARSGRLSNAGAKSGAGTLGVPRRESAQQMASPPNGLMLTSLPPTSFGGGAELMPTRTSASQVSFASDFSLTGDSEKDKKSPQPNLHTIQETPHVPDAVPENEDEDEDAGMDFFQMLNSAPPATSPESNNIGLPSRPRRSTLNGIMPPSPTLPQMLLSPPSDITRQPSVRRLILLGLPQLPAGSIFSGKEGKRDRVSGSDGSNPDDHVASLSFGKDTTAVQSAMGGMGQAPTHTFFDFVNMNGRKPLTELSTKEAWWPVVFVSIVFLIWGFAYGLIGTLNSEIISLLNYSPSQSIALSSAYWQGYVIGPLLVGYWTLTCSGFKATFMAGLTMYATGAMAFWPSSILRSYPGFYISNLIIASGLSVLEIAANPFIALAGPGEYSEARLCFAQGIQAIGGTVSPILAQKALFQNVDGANLFIVQWCYLAIALFVVFLAVVFFYVPLSEASDFDLEVIAESRLQSAQLPPIAVAPVIPPFFSPQASAKYLLLVTGVIGLWFYVGAQEATAYYWSGNTMAVRPGTDPFWDAAIGHALFAFGRFVAAGLTFYGVPPNYALAFFIIGSFITSLLGMVAAPGRFALAMLILVFFFESAIFPLLFAMTLRNMGKLTKLASCALVIAISGGTVWPSVTHAVHQNHLGSAGVGGSNARRGMIVTVVLYGVSMLIPWMWNSDVMRRWIDPKWSKSKRSSVSTDETAVDQTQTQTDAAEGARGEGERQGYGIEMQTAANGGFGGHAVGVGGGSRGRVGGGGEGEGGKKWIPQNFWSVSPTTEKKGFNFALARISHEEDRDMNKAGIEEVGCSTSIDGNRRPQERDMG